MPASSAWILFFSTSEIILMFLALFSTEWCDGGIISSSRSMSSGLLGGVEYTSLLSNEKQVFKYILDFYVCHEELKYGFHWCDFDDTASHLHQNNDCVPLGPYNNSYNNKYHIYQIIIIMIIIVIMFITARIGWPCSLPYVNLTSLALLVILPEQGLCQKHCFLNNYYCQNWGLYWLMQPASSDFIQMISALGLNISGWL